MAKLRSPLLGAAGSRPRQPRWETTDRFGCSWLASRHKTEHLWTKYAQLQRARAEPPLVQAAHVPAPAERRKLKDGATAGWGEERFARTQLSAFTQTPPKAYC